MAKQKSPFGEKNLQDLLLLGANDEFKTDLDNLHKKYGISSNSKEINGKESLELMQDPRLMEFLKESTELIFKHNISTIFSLVIALLTKKGHLTKAASGENINVDVKEITEFLISSSGIKLADKGKDYYDLRLYRETTIKDVQARWKEIKNSLGKGSGRKKISKNLERDLYIKKLKDQGMTAKEIVKKVRENDKFGNQIIGYEEVPTIEKRLKIKATKNISHKDS